MYTRRTLELFGLMMILGVGHALLKHYILIDIKSPALAFMRQTTGLKVFDGSISNPFHLHLLCIY